MRSRTLALLLLVAVAGAARAGYDEALEKGRAAARELNETLRQRLTAVLKESGPLHAVGVCSYQVQALVGEVARSRDVKVKRTSLRLRNPNNAPDAYEKELLVRLGDQASRNTLPEEVFERRREGGRSVYRYARPIVLVPACVVCHGGESDVPEDVRKEIRHRYPEDAAMGYGAGDFRGIVSVVIPDE